MNPSRSGTRALVIALMFAVLGALLWSDYKKEHASPESIGYSAFLHAAEAGEVAEATLDAQSGVIEGKIRREGRESKFSTVVYPADLTLAERLSKWKVPFEVKPHAAEWIESVLYTWVPAIVLFVLFYYFFIRQFQQTGNRAFTFGKSNARLASEGTRPKTTFKDVAGVEEAKQELEEVVEFLKDPGKFTRLGARIPKGVLLVGHPGCGKTLLAKAVAGEANVPFFSMSGSDFVEMFVGVGASRVRDIFEQGRKSAPCIIFIDEIDAVGRHRGWGLGGGHDEREQTLNALLVQMDGFEEASGVILLAATNRPDILDPALLRPGRFDRRVTVDLPDLEGRLGILFVHTKKVPLDAAVDLSVIARGTPFFSGADLANLVNEAALIAAAAGKAAIGMPDLEAARDKVMMGPERKSRKVSEKEKRIVAVHEAGHALVAKRLPGTDPIHKVTLIPRGTYALGATYQLPERDKYLKSRGEYANDIAVLLGGRAAEELLLNEITGGASSDLERATAVARQMVCSLGMSRLGPLAYGSVREELFLGREISREQNYSEATAREIDQEIRRIIDEGDAIAREILTRDRATLESISNALIDREVLDGNEIDLLAEGKALPPRVLPTLPVPSAPASEAKPRPGIVPTPQPA